MESSVREDPRRGHHMSFGLAKIFSHEELKKATNSFDSSQVLGSGGFGKVYLGKLQGEMVAIKKIYDDSPEVVAQFLNEVAVLSRIRHQNLVALHGCTNSRSHELLLVYEFVANGTVEEHLTLQGQRSPLTWDMRIRIAIETAEALTYLHALEPPIIHCDVKTSNILLDNAFHVKVADLGFCRLVPWDTTHVSTLPGTMGYRDPEYEHYCRLTDKSDVYSFGVVLLELLSGMKAVDVERGLENIYLNEVALNKIKNNKLKELIDPKLGCYSDNSVKRMFKPIAELACECLQVEGKMRPTMVKVSKVLKDIKEDLAQFNVFTHKELSHAFNVFTHKELSHATKSFRWSSKIGSKIYLGNVEGRMVAVKVRHEKPLSWRKTLFDKAKDLYQIRHTNLATLYGSTDESSKKMLFVYEYAPNGSLGYHLHRSGMPPKQKQDRKTIDWAFRIRIAIETAEALSYLHSFEPPVVYTRLTINNILFDENYHVKLNGLSVSSIWKNKGNQDPEFGGEAKIITTNYNVYSFGVVLLQLISDKKAFGLAFSSEVYLTKRALEMIHNNELGKLVDPKLDYHSDSETKRMVTSVAELACRCLLPKGSMRPTMAEVLSDLKKIRVEVAEQRKRTSKLSSCAIM